MTWRDQLGKERLEERFLDLKPPLSDAEAVIEANRCIHCYEAPCITACPTEINIPQFIGRIATQNVIGAAKTILDSNVLGHSCAVSCPTEVLCEGACVYNHLNKKPILIGKLQRYAVEHAYHQGVSLYQAGSPTGKRVALIGAGPASLACAHELRKKGHETVIFEKLKLPGGLNTYGIAPYKMKSEASLWEIEQVAALGVQFEFEKELGKNLDLAELLNHYDAVFLGMGLGPDSRLKISGSENPLIQSRTFGAVEFISQLKTSRAADLTWLGKMQSALVIGGGNTALDACRELKALGIPRVVVSYRRDEEQMSGYRHELKWARQEGVEFQFQTLPVEFLASESQDIRVRLARTKTEGEDIAKSVVVTDEILEFDVQIVLLATGQSKLTELLAQVPGLSFEQGCLKVDSRTGRTDHPKIYAGGDLVNGGKEVVNAVAEGKRAALAIHQELFQTAVPQGENPNG